MNTTTLNSALPASPPTIMPLDDTLVPSSPTAGSPTLAWEDNPEIAALPRILLMGPRRSGKTSIQRVVFSKMSPHETLFRLEPTQQLERFLVDHTPLCRYTLWDFPGDYYSHDDDAVFASAVSGSVVALVFVVDAQDEPYDHVLQSFTTAVTHALSINPNIVTEVFINKVDGELFLSDDSKYDCRRDVMTQVADELGEVGLAPDAVQIRYHLTSIYDHSIYEALSRVVQQLIPQLPTLENLLDVLVSTCSMEKVYLFDVVSKLYLSTDSGPVDMQSVELCSDMIDVVLDVSGIYGLGPSHEAHQRSFNNISHNSNVVVAGNNSEMGLTSSLVSSSLPNLVSDSSLDEELVDPDSAYDVDSASVIRLSNGMVLYLKEVDAMLALVCITRSENFRKKSLINHNIGCLKQALRALAQPATLPTTPSTKSTTGNNDAISSLLLPQRRVAE